MKKIMFALAAAAMAVGAQAAQFEWSLSQVREGWADGSIKADGTAYLFLVGTQGATEAAVASAISGAADSTALATSLSAMAIDSAAVSAGSVIDTTPDGIAATAPAQLFFAVISDDGHVYQGAAITVDTIETLGFTTAAFGSQKSATQTAGGWTDKSGGGGGGGGGVPEPTSGLLLVVGGAMLALRRKR